MVNDPELSFKSLMSTTSYKDNQQIEFYMGFLGLSSTVDWNGLFMKRYFYSHAKNPFKMKRYVFYGDNIKNLQETRVYIVESIQIAPPGQAA